MGRINAAIIGPPISYIANFLFQNITLRIA